MRKVSAIAEFSITAKNIFENFLQTIDKSFAKAYTIIEHLKKYSNERRPQKSGRQENMEEIEKTDTVATSAEEVRKKLPDDGTIYELAELFKMFGDPTRAKILGCLQVRDLCVGELAEVLGMSVSAVSHQLRVLRGAKLVKGTKEGKEVKYSLDDDHVAKIMECGLTHVNEER